MLRYVVREFRRNIAVLIGIDDYRHGIPKLTTAVRDAEALGRCLADQHDYDIILRLDGDADLAGMRRLFRETLPAALDPDDRLVFYFAGHGIVQDGDDGPEGFLVPRDAKPEDRDTLFPMVEAAAALEALPAHHMLLVFDCCFAGSFRWTSTRSFLPAAQTLYRKRYERFLDHPAAQVLTSAAQDEKALDVIDGLTIGERDTPGGHSPFATALLEGLKGHADKPGPDGEKDGVITATELYMYVRDVVELAAEDRGTQQTPGMWPLARHDRGEFLFHTPGVEAVIREDPPLDYESNPWRGLRSYTKDERHLFFGRSRVVDELVELVNEPGKRLLAVVGASGSGKSSVVNAGLIPRISGGGDATANESGVWWIVGPMRPAKDPLAMLGAARERLAAAPKGTQRLLIIDQFEEVFTMSPDEEVQQEFLGALAEWTDGRDPSLQVIITLRADFEPQVRSSALQDRLRDGRYAIPPMTREEMREVIDGPAADKVLYYEPPGLPDRLLDDLAAMPGALPLLSFTLAELYRRYIEQDERTDRALQESDYDAIGGVVGSLQTRASELHAGFSPEEQRTMRNLMLRMVTDEGGDLAKRRLGENEQQWPDPKEVARVRTVLDQLIGARLLVSGGTDGADGDRVAYVEPAHDMLVMSWDQIRRWQHDLDEPLKLRRELWQAAVDWDSGSGSKRRRREQLWHDDVRLPQVAANLSSADRWMNALETDFVSGSVRHKERRRQRSSVTVMLIVGVLLGITIYALIAKGNADASARKAIREETAAKASEDLATAALIKAEESAAAAEVSAQEARDNMVIAEENAAEAARQTGIADGKTRDAEKSAAEAAESAREAEDAKDKAERALARTRASQSRSLTRMRGRGNEALTMAVLAAAEDEHLRPDDTATAVLSEVLNTVRGPTFGDGAVAAVAMLGDVVVTGGRDGHLMAWAPGQWDRAKPPTPIHRAAITALASQGDVVASADAAGRVRFSRRSDTSTTGLETNEKRSVDVGAAVRHLEWGEGGLVIGADDGSITMASLDGPPRRIPAMTRPLRSLAVSDTGRLAAGGEDGRIALIETNGDTTWLEGHAGWVNSLDFAPTNDGTAGARGAELVSAGEDGTLRLWGEQALVLRGHEGPVQSARFDPTGTYVASASWDGSVRIWSARSGEQLAALAGHGDWVWSVDWASSGRLLLSAGEDGTARVWSWSKAQVSRPVGILAGHDGWVREAHFTVDQQRAVTIGGDGRARLWSIEGGDASPLGSVGADLRRAHGGGDAIASVSSAGTGFVWNSSMTGGPPEGLSMVRAVTTAPGGVPLFGMADGAILRLDGGKDRSPGRIQEGSSPITALVAEGRIVAAGDDDGRLAVWPDGLRGPRTDLEGHEEEVYSISLLGDDLLTVGREGLVRNWHPFGADPPTQFRPSAPPLAAVLAAPDRALVGLATGQIEGWTSTSTGWARDGRSLRLDASIVDMSTSVDRTQVAAVSRDGTALVFDAFTLAPLARYDDADIVSVLFDDDRGVITVTRDGTATRRPTSLLSYEELACSWLTQAAYTPARRPCSRD